MTQAHVAHTDADLDIGMPTLRERLRGEVLEPGDVGYDAARRVWNATRITPPI